MRLPSHKITLLLNFLQRRCCNFPISIDISLITGNYSLVNFINEIPRVFKVRSRYDVRVKDKNAILNFRNGFNLLGYQSILNYPIY